MQRDIESYFNGVIENINSILNDDYYKDKFNLLEIKEQITKWYNDYKNNETLVNINPKELENISLEITDFFDVYFKDESLVNNYSERLLYDFNHLMKYWKDELLGEKNNG